MYPFANKEDVTLMISSKAKDDFFGFQLTSDNLTGRTYVKEVTDSVFSTTAKAFNTLESSCKHLCGVYITHIDNVPVFSTAQAITQLQILYEQFKQAQEQGWRRISNFKPLFLVSKIYKGMN